MSFDANSLFASLVIGSIGLGLTLYGRRARRFPHLVAGLVLIIYPYFVSSVMLMIGIAVGVLAALWLALRLRY